MISTEDIVALQQFSFQSQSAIKVPILISPWIKEMENLGIEVIEISQNKQKSELKATNRKTGNYVDPNDKRSWYQIKSSEKQSCLLKIKNNFESWPQPCFFPANINSICCFKDVIAVSLVDFSLCFVDSYSGCCCLPSQYIEGGVEYMKSFNNEILACGTGDSRILLWEITQNSSLRLLIDVFFFEDFSSIENIIITNELETKAISPIVICGEKQMRWSDKCNAWVKFNYDVPKIFTKTWDYETIDDVEKAFARSLLKYNSSVFSDTFRTIFSLYSEGSDNKCILLMRQIMKRMSEKIDVYCGVPIQEMYDSAIQYINENSPNLLSDLYETPEYKKLNDSHACENLAEIVIEKPIPQEEHKPISTNLEETVVNQIEVSSTSEQSTTIINETNASMIETTTPAVDENWSDKIITSTVCEEISIPPVTLGEPEVVPQDPPTEENAFIHILRQEPPINEKIQFIEEQENHEKNEIPHEEQKNNNDTENMINESELGKEYDSRIDIESKKLDFELKKPTGKKISVARQTTLLETFKSK